MRLSLPVLASLLAGPALAEVPRVVADTAPVHSLVAIVMGDLGAPALAVPPGTSPHGSGLTPSEAGAIEAADLIVWTGPGLLPWMGDAIAALAPEAATLELLATPGWVPLPPRAGLDLHEGHDEVGPADGDGIDPHAWLDPAVAGAWLGAIGEALAAADPENAAAYRANAEAAQAEAARLAADLATRLAPFAGTGYAVGHDATQYLERAAGLPAGWAIAGADGAAGAPSDIAALREAVLAGEVRCLLLDAETDDRWAGTLGEGTALATARIDPDGVLLEPGPGLYPALIETLAAALEACLAG